MEINIQSLKSLCFTHSVAGDTEEIIDYLQKRLSELKIKSQITSYGVLVFGNLQNPKIMISAHADEIGFQVIKKNSDGTFMVNNSGHVTPVMLNNNHVYVKSDKGLVEGFFYSKKELGDNKPDHFTEIFLDTLDNDSINIGDFGSYSRVFNSKKDKVIATGLDNKTSVEMILELVEENQSLLKDILFAFVTEEETTYDCIAGLSSLYKPEYALVLDMLPVNQQSPTKAEAIPEMDKGPAILFSMHSYHLHPKLKKLVKKLKSKFQYAFLDIDFPPEPQIVQRNGITKGMNIFLPMLGWHNSCYTMKIKDYVKMKKLVLEISQLLESYK